MPIEGAIHLQSHNIPLNWQQILNQFRDAWGYKVHGGLNISTHNKRPSVTIKCVKSLLKSISFDPFHLPGNLLMM